MIKDGYRCGVGNNKKVAECASCFRCMKITAKGLCAACYKRQRPHRVCDVCQTLKPNRSKGMCHNCYRKYGTPIIECGICHKKKPSDRAGVCSPCAGLLHKHDITIAQHQEIVKHGCMICGAGGRPVPGVRLCIDHDHKTGRVRGCLCTRCNLALGHIETGLLKRPKFWALEAERYLDLDKGIRKD